jgi:hypothetical protein
MPLVKKEREAKIRYMMLHWYKKNKHKSGKVSNKLLLGQISKVASIFVASLNIAGKNSDMTNMLSCLIVERLYNLFGRIIPEAS